MKKIFRMTMLLAMMMAACVSMGSCSSSDDEPEYVPVESAFSKLLKEKPVHQLNYGQNYGKGFFALWSDAQVGNYKTDYYVIDIVVYNAPADDMYDGRYEVAEVGAAVWGWKEQWQARIQEERTEHMEQQPACQRRMGGDQDSRQRRRVW